MSKYCRFPIESWLLQLNFSNIRFQIGSILYEKALWMSRIRGGGFGVKVWLWMNWAPQLIVNSKTSVYQHTRTTKEVQFMVQKMMCELNDTIWSDLNFPPLYTNVQIAFVPWKSWWKNYKLKDCQLRIASSEGVLSFPLSIVISPFSPLRGHQWTDILSTSLTAPPESNGQQLCIYPSDPCPAINFAAHG
jgi:hypothetical protein